MRFNKSFIKVNVGLFCLTLFFQNCTSNYDIAVVDADSGSQSSNVDSTQPTDVTESNSTNGTTQNNNKMCYTQELRQPLAELVNKIDILFISDTSGSLAAERTSIATEMRAFVEELPSNINYHIGVMPAHGSVSKYTGHLFQNGKNPAVIKSSDLSLTDISKILVDNFNNIPSDYYSDGGEEGLYSLSRALDESNLLTFRELDFLRPDAALAIVFVSDENDICYRYPASIIPVPDGDKLEAPAFIRDCDSIFPETVYEKLKLYMQERPLVISGILYNNTMTMGKKGGEDEIGYGYLDLIQLNKGLSVDLSVADFHKGLKDIGSLATKRIQLISEVKLNYKDNIDPTSLVTTIDGKIVPAQIINGMIELGDELGMPNSLVEFKYCEQ